MSGALNIGSAAFERLLATTNLYISMLFELIEEIRDNEPTSATLLQKYAVNTAEAARELMEQWPYLLVRRNDGTSATDASAQPA